MKTLDIFVLKNFTEKRAIEFANSICNCARNLGLLKFKNIVIKKNKYIKLCAKPSDEDLIKIEAYNNGAPLAENLDLFNDRHFILLVGLYLLNNKDAQKKYKFKLQKDEQALWFDADFKAQKVEDAKEYYSYLKMLPIMEDMGQFGEILDYTKIDPIILVCALNNVDALSNVIVEKKKTDIKNEDVIINEQQQK